jgi:hypothetical protein
METPGDIAIDPHILGVLKKISKVTPSPFRRQQDLRVQ